MSKRILIVEDDPTIQELYAAVLGGFGYELLPVMDGLEAVSLLDSQQFDLILLDIMLPRMSGYDILERLGKDSSHPPVVVFSALEEESGSLDALTPGCVVTVAKGSVPMSAIAKAVSSYLGQPPA